MNEELTEIVRASVIQNGVFSVKPNTFHANSETSTEASSNNTSSNENTTITLQKGVFRVNCVDCLDRTNVTMFLIGYINFEVEANFTCNI